MRKSIVSMPFLLILLAQFIPLAAAHNSGFPISYNSTHMIIDTIGEPESLDPAWAYDTSSGAVIMNVYETLVFFGRDYTKGPTSTGQVDTFEPKLATSWTISDIDQTSPDGLIWKKRFIFSIRPGVTFHDGHALNASDVEYSFEREMVQDRNGGPQWMLYHPLLGVYAASDATADPNFGSKIAHSVESDNTARTVTLNLVIPVPTLTMLQVLSQTWSSVLEKNWAVALGDFDGNWTASWATIYANWHNPSISRIEGQMMGTGPYEFSYWTRGVAYSIIKNNAYWDGWPARVSSGSSERIGDSITTVTWNYFPEWTTRRPRFLVGDSDLTNVDREYRDQVLEEPGMRPFYPFKELSVSAMFFTFNISDTSPYASWNAPGVFTQEGCPTNIFSDINVRKGFAYAFDYNGWLAAAYLGEGSQPSDPIIQGVLYDNPAQTKYYFNLGVARTYLTKAWDGALWQNGMTFTITYNTGNVARQTAAEMIANYINSLNPKFHLSTLGIPWGSVYLPQMVAGELPIFIIGWLADYPDPDDFAFPFMHSQGTFAAWQKYNNPTVDSLIVQGATTPDGSARQQIYYNLQSLYYNDAPSVCLVQPVGRHFERDWVRGWYYNQIYSGNYYYHMWKAKTHFGDTNNDDTVNVADAAIVSAYWTGAPGSTYNPVADISGGKGGLLGTTYVRGMPDGKVDIADIGLISAFFDGPPQGPAHP